MKIDSEAKMLQFGIDFAKNTTPPKVVELIGDVGAGKTTFVRGLAKGLGVEESVTSPSFTISKQYAFPGGVLIHYDFYRLQDPGIMSEDLLEAIKNPSAIVIVEWADSVKNLLPADHTKIKIEITGISDREIKIFKKA